MLETLYRRTLLGLAESPPIERLLRAKGMSLGVGRFVAGETVEQAVAVAAELEDSGMLVILDLLGEFVTSEAGARKMTREVITGVAALAKSTAAPAMSVKPTQLGLGIDYGLALGNAREIAEQARLLGAEICLDMENHPHVDGTLELFRALHGEGFTNVSTVLQSYLKRSEADLDGLLGLDPRPTLRIVKGAYREPPEVAFQKASEVASRFRSMVYRLLEAGGKANVATHDDRILRETAAFLRGSGQGRANYEFQLLHGVKPKLQRTLSDAGHPVRVYVPYGHDWYGYFSRRLAERPANLAFVLRGLVG